MFVSNGKDATVSVIDTATSTVIATIPVGKRPWNMALTPDGKKLYVACGRSDSVSVIDTEQREADRHQGRRAALGRRDPVAAGGWQRRA